VRDGDGWCYHFIVVLQLSTTVLIPFDSIRRARGDEGLTSGDVLDQRVAKRLVLLEMPHV
jgi:hypothetical protein